MRSFEFTRKWVGEGFERCPYLNENLEFEKQYPEAKLPEYATLKSAGADFFCAKEVTIPSIWGTVASSLIVGEDKVSLINIISHNLSMQKDGELKQNIMKKESQRFAPTLVHTGIKARMEDDEVLELYNRSSNPSKLGLVLANSVGVVDADYYENPDNDGEIMFAFYNFMPWSVTLKVGDKLGQGVFKKFLRPTEGLVINDTTRTGGFGSTNK